MLSCLVLPHNRTPILHPGATSINMAHQTNTGNLIDNNNTGLAINTGHMTLYSSSSRVKLREVLTIDKLMVVNITNQSSSSSNWAASIGNLNNTLID